MGRTGVMTKRKKKIYTVEELGFTEAEAEEAMALAAMPDAEREQIKDAARRDLFEQREAYIDSFLSSRVKPETLERRRRLYDIVAEMNPMSVRQVFYQATVRGIVPKDEKLGYKVVVADLCRMRESGELPYEWLEDRGRWVRRPYTFISVRSALEDAAQQYRKDLWFGADCRVQIWLEKDALAAVVEPITAKYDVPLMVSRGYASKSFLHSVAQDMSEDLPTYIYHLGDFDPSGVNAGEKIEETLTDLAPDADIHFERIAVTEEQIAEWDLPTRPTKQSDTRAERFGSDVSVELDAIDPNRLRAIVQEAIQRHLPPRRFKALMKAEKRERTTIARLVDNITEDD
jgi:hypothetical protein